MSSVEGLQEVVKKFGFALDQLLSSIIFSGARSSD